MAKYKMLGGTYNGRDGRSYTFSKSQETIVEESIPLDELFKGQWMKVGGDPPFPVPPEEQMRRNPVAWEEVMEKGPEEKVPASQTAPTGEESRGVPASPEEDVTGDFDGAKEAKVAVTKKGDTFYIHKVGRGGVHKEPVGRSTGYTREQDVKAAIHRASEE